MYQTLSQHVVSCFIDFILALYVLTFNFSDCTNGEVRLMEGNSSSGRVEICYDNSYGSVCDNQWDIINAGVVCRQLGFSFSSKSQIE